MTNEHILEILKSLTIRNQIQEGWLLPLDQKIFLDYCRMLPVTILETEENKKVFSIFKRIEKSEKFNWKRDYLRRDDDAFWEAREAEAAKWEAEMKRLTKYIKNMDGK